MLKSRNLVETFSCFILCQSTAQAQWRTERDLLHHMTQTLAECSDLESCEGWSLYWLKAWQQIISNSSPNHAYRNLPFRHLFAYLQEPAWHTAKRVYKRCSSHLKEYELCDLLSLALLKVPSVLHNFNAGLGSHLGAYASSSFYRALLDENRRVSTSAGDSDWGLLVRTSTKRLTQSLLQVIPAEQLDDHLKVIDFYREWSAPSHPRGRRNLQEPTIADCEQIAIAYHRDEPHRTQGHTAAIDAPTVKEWLKTSIQSIRLYTKTRVESLNQPLGEDQGVERIDLESADSLSIDDLARAEALQQVNQLLTHATEALLHPPPQKTPKKQQKADQIAQFLPLIYGDLMSQEQVGQAFQIRQTTVCRRRQEAKQILWDVLQHSLQGSDSLSPSQNPQTFKDYSRLLDAWLYQYFATSHTEPPGDNHEHP